MAKVKSEKLVEADCSLDSSGKERIVSSEVKLENSSSPQINEPLSHDDKQLSCKVSDNTISIESTTANTEESKDDSSAREGVFYFVCGICRQWSYTRSSLVIHIAGHFHECSSCEACGETFTEAQDYADHCAEHVGWGCIACGETFFEASDFEAHLLEHRLMCPVCKKSFCSEEKLRDHYPEHEEMINLQCGICLEYFRSKRSLKNHAENQHKVKTRSFECKVCHEKFTQLSSRNRHYQVIHKNVKAHVCHLCGKKYSIKGSLETHLLNHAGEKPYACLVCGRSFADKRNFKKHGLEHIAHESAPCKFCGRVFPSERKLRSHLWFHNNSGTYRCDICPRAFSYSSHLKRHVLAHNDVRNEVCEVCGRAYVAKPDLRRHLRKKHGLDAEAVERAILKLKFGVQEGTG